MDTIQTSVPVFSKGGPILDFDFWLDMTQHPTVLNVQTQGQMLLVDTQETRSLKLEFLTYDIFVRKAVTST
jgi:hypothetical protein